MITLYKQDGEILYGIKEFLLDAEEDVVDLPTNIKSGSSAIVLSTGNVYFLNGAKQWVPMMSNNTSNGGNSSTDCSCEDILNQLDKDGDGTVDQAQSAGSIVMYEM